MLEMMGKKSLCYLCVVDSIQGPIYKLPEFCLIMYYFIYLFLLRIFYMHSICT